VAEIFLLAAFVTLFRNTRVMSNLSRHSSARSNHYTPLEEIVLPALSPVTPAPAPLPFFASPAPKTEAETADVFGSHDPWADVQATPTPRCTRPSTRHASRAPTPFVLEPLDSAYHWNDQTYATLEDVVIASGCTFGVLDNLSQWLNVVIREFTRRNVVVGYNALGDCIQAMDTRIAESMNEFETAVYGRFNGFTEHIASVQNMLENAAQTAHLRIDRLDKRVEEQTEDMDAIDKNVQKVHQNLKKTVTYTQQPGNHRLNFYMATNRIGQDRSCHCSTRNTQPNTTL
jgi:hypothetical protein